MPNRLDDFFVLLHGSFAVIADINGSKHDALHVAAHVGNVANQHLITSEPGDAHMERSIGFYEVLVAGGIVGDVFGLRELAQFVEQFLIVALARGKFGARALDGGAKFINFVEPADGHRTDEVTSIGNDAKKIFLLQADGGFTNGSSAAAVAA